MSQRLFTQPSVQEADHFVGYPLASPVRRLCAILIDFILLFIPTILISVMIAYFSLSLIDPGAANGIRTLLTNGNDAVAVKNAHADIAPLLVRMNAPGLPASVYQAVEKSEYAEAGRILQSMRLDISFSFGRDASPLRENEVRLEVESLIPYRIRGFSILSFAGLYFTILTAGSIQGTIGKKLLGIRVVRLDNRPLTYWESFERFGGYMASIGTFGLGLLDIKRNPNYRLAHDRISNTAVIRNKKPKAKKGGKTE